MIEFFMDDRNIELLKNEFFLKILENYLQGENCNQDSFNVFNLHILNLEILEERKFLIPFNRWKSLQTSKDPIVQNVFWNVCDTKNLAHHEIRDGINEVNENLQNQCNNLAKFIFIEQNGSFCCFWLYTRKINEELFFNATVMVLPRIGDLFKFDKNGNCIHK
jgi:hypothetical protein